MTNDNEDGIPDGNATDWYTNCRDGRLHHGWSRMYARTKYMKGSSFFNRRYTGGGRGFEPIGWYCDWCKSFQLEDDEVMDEISNGIVRRVVRDDDKKDAT